VIEKLVDVSLGTSPGALAGAGSGAAAASGFQASWQAAQAQPKLAASPAWAARQAKRCK